eukprot:TRINITY_DN3948_c0_g1_i2.p1 TRINITY_DN3948_c0_g1~~TRINITY_DN3948_c0_g1_i2.p1  ORF type:complete len:120 (-),score=20.39 TRINITY_DN3948_c0_g1_i2:284-643(-)
MSAALIGNPTLFQCFNALLPAGVFMPEDVEPIQLRSPTPAPVVPTHPTKKRRKTLPVEPAQTAELFSAAGEREVCGVISTRGVPCKQAKSVCPYHQKEVKASQRAIHETHFRTDAEYDR